MAAGPGPGRLAGRCVLLTRPRSESDALAAGIEAQGGRALVFPTLEIQPEPLSDAARAALLDLHRAQLVVFISVNAVRHGMPHIEVAGGWPPRLAAAAVGHATAEALRACSVREVWAPPAGGDSEALLALPELQAVAGWRVLIFRGVGGREQLAQGLAARGAEVRYVECYRRAAPPADPAPLRAALDAGDLNAAVASSSEGVRNLLQMAGAHASALHDVPLVVTHENIAQAARELGFRHVAVARDAHDGVLDVLAALPARHAG
jgi:uroporphyrinogen-III synthase